MKAYRSYREDAVTLEYYFNDTIPASSHYLNWRENRAKCVVTSQAHDERRAIR